MKQINACIPLRADPQFSTDSSIVFVVDDDIALRESLELLIRRAGWQARSCASASEFLALPRVRVPSCLVLDVTLPDVSGLEVQSFVADRADLPIIFITGHADISIAVQAMKAGAVEFLMKPFGEQMLLSAIHEALERSRRALCDAAAIQILRDRYASLTRREKEVMALVASGLLNKQVGSELSLAEITVKTHRGSVMRKMAATCLAELVRMAATLGLAVPPKRKTSGAMNHATDIAFRDQRSPCFLDVSPGSTSTYNFR